MRELLDNPKENEYLSEFKQKIAQEMQEDIELRRRELERSRNGLIGSIAGIILAFVVSWFLLLPHFGIGQNEEIPLIKRPVLPVKIQPSEPGGMEILNQDKTVYALVEKKSSLDTKVESLLPPPETPKMPVIEPLQEEIVDTPKEDQQTSEIKDMSDLIDSINTTATEKIVVPQKLGFIDVNILKADQKNIQSTSNTQQATDMSNNSTEEISAVKTPVSNQTIKTDSQFQIQLMALSKKDAIEKGYRQLLGKFKTIQGLPHQIKQGPQDSLYRLFVGAFQTKAEAQQLCDEIRKNGGSCMVKEN